MTKASFVVSSKSLLHLAQFLHVSEDLHRVRNFVVPEMN